MVNDWKEQNAKALNALDRGEIALAENTFLRASFFRNYRAYNNLGWFYYMQGTDNAARDSIVEAMYWLKKALRQSRNPIILQNVASLRAENGDYAGALCLLQEARKSDSDVILLYNIGVCLYRMGNREAAASFFKTVDNANEAKRIRLCGAVHPRLSYAFCVSDGEQVAALQRYAPERNEDELLDYILLCVQCKQYQMAQPDIIKLISQWGLTDEILALIAKYLRQYPVEKERILCGFPAEAEEEKKKALRLIKNPKECSVLLARAAFRPTFAQHNGYFE